MNLGNPFRQQVHTKQQSPTTNGLIHSGMNLANPLHQPDNPQQQSPSSNGLDTVVWPALFHLGFRLPQDEPLLRERFRAVKIVLLCGSPTRAAMLSEAVAQSTVPATAPPHAEPPSIPRMETRIPLTSEHHRQNHQQNLCSTDRYTLFQPHPAVLSASHGIGKGSSDILFHEITSMLRVAGATGFVYIRVGSCGGCGVPPGSIVVSESVVDPTGTMAVMRTVVLGKPKEYPARLNAELTAKLLSCASALYGKDHVLTGRTMCCETFYDGQARLDGAFTDYSADDRACFLRSCRDAGIVNFEMESLVLAAFCTRANIPAAVLCVALVDRLDGKADSPHAPVEDIQEWEQRPIQVIAYFVARQLLHSNISL